MFGFRASARGESETPWQDKIQFENGLCAYNKYFECKGSAEILKAANMNFLCTACGMLHYADFVPFKRDVGIGINKSEVDFLYLAVELYLILNIRVNSRQLLR